MAEDYYWSEEAIQRLRTLWDEGYVTAEIAARMGITKNMAIGKAHRLKLPPRPSPIKPDNSRRQALMAAIAPNVKRLAEGGFSRTQIRISLKIPYQMVCDILGPDYVRAPKVAEPKPLLDDPYKIAAQEVRAERAVEKISAPRAPIQRPIVANRTISKRCCWMDGDRSPFRQCEEPPVSGPEGRVWCSEHRSRVFIRRQEAA